MDRRVIDTYNIQKYIPGEEIYVKSSKTKYHYASPEGLLSIISNTEVYFTDIRYFNDKSENSYIFNCFDLFLENHPNEYNVLRNLMNILFPTTEKSEDYLENPKFPFADKSRRAFVFCTCVDKDSLCMWNYYVKNGNYNGYNIGLNPTEIIRSFEKESSEINVLFGNVIYSMKDQQKEIKLVADKLEKEFEGENNELAGLVLLYKYFQQYSAFFKNDKFSHEKEYRFVISINEDMLSDYNGHAMKFSFRINNGIVVPYIALKFNKSALKHVTLSPNAEEISRESLIELCNMKGYRNVTVDASKIPIRF